MEEKEQKESEEEQKEEVEVQPDDVVDAYESSGKDTKVLLYAIGFIILLFAVFFLTQYFYESPKEELETYTYNGFEFYNLAGLWHTNWQRQNEIFSIHLRYGPRESDDIEILGVDDAESFSITDKVYITFDPEGEDLAYVALASTELTLSLKNAFLVNATASCLVNKTEACSKRPIITCDNTNDTVIYMREANETGVFIDGNCLIIQGRGEEIVRAADRVIWGWYGIIDTASVATTCTYNEIISDDEEAVALAAQKNAEQCPGEQTCIRNGACEEIEVQEGTAYLCQGICS